MQVSKGQTNNDGKCNPSKNLDATRQNIAQSTCCTQNVRSSALFGLSDENTCRICHLSTKKKELLSHCQCKGSLGLVHSSCLLLWIKKSGSVTCEICREKYSTISQLNKTIWQWKLPRVRAKGWIKLFFFIGFLSLLITFTTWALWSSLSLSQEAKRQRSNKYNWLSYVICCVLLLIPVLVMGVCNFRSFVNYVSKCIRINQEITVVPKAEGEFGKDKAGIDNVKDSDKKKGNSEFKSRESSCNHDWKNYQAQVQESAYTKDGYHSYVTCNDDFHGETV